MRSLHFDAERQARWLPPLGMALSAVAVVASLIDSTGQLRTRIDTEVYVLGAQQLLNGGNLYLESYDTSLAHLPFTYPPFAALVFTMLTPFGTHGAGAVLCLLNIAITWSLLTMMLQALGLQQSKRWAWLALPIVLVTEPVWQTIATYGQINFILALLVVVDVLILPKHLRGPLIGVAAAIKLTPAVFALVYVFNREWRAVLQSIGGFLAATAVAWVVSPANSLTYWAGTLTNTDRIGGRAYAGNQSISGILARLGHDPTGEAWFLVVTALGILLCGALWRVASVAEPSPARNLFAVCLAFLAAGLGSPVAWSHHFVWFIPLALVLVAHRQWWLGGLVTVAILARSMWWLPNGHDLELSWPWWGHIIGSVYLWVGLAVLIVVLACPAPRLRKLATPIDHCQPPVGGSQGAD